MPAAYRIEMGSNPHQIKNTQPRVWLSVFWQRMRDSNPRKRSQSPVCYRYTNPLFCDLEISLVETGGLEPSTSCV